MKGTRPRRSTRAAPRPWLQVWLLAALLLAAQAFGLAHRVAHAPGLHCDHPHHHGAASPLAGHEAGSAECRLIDQLAHADALFGSPVLPPLLAPEATALVAAALPARPQGGAAAYLARAPPQAGHGAAPSA